MQHSNCYARNVEMGQKRTLGYLKECPRTPAVARVHECAHHRLSTERARHSHAAWWRVASNVCRSVAVPAASLTVLRQLGNPNLCNGSPIAALWQETPLAHGFKIAE